MRGICRSSHHFSNCRVVRSMGNNGRPRAQRAQSHEFERPPPQPRPERWDPSTKMPSFPQSSPPQPSVDSRSNFGTDNPFHLHHHPAQPYPHNSPQRQGNKQPRSFRRTPQNYNVFLHKSLRLKQNLVRTFTQALRQIEQWYQDEGPGGDLMDWQPEDELVIPQSDNTAYIHRMGVAQKDEYVCARKQVSGARARTFSSASFKHFRLFSSGEPMEWYTETIS